MERRDFVKALATAAVATQVVPDMAEALTAHIEGLRAAVDDAKDEAKLWRRVRREFSLNPGFVHFNCGSTGAPPRYVIDTVCHYLRSDEMNPWAHAFPSQSEVIGKVAQFIGAEAEEVTLTRNTTESMNMIATGLHLKPGDEVLTTNHEHAGGMLCWQYLAKFHGVKLRYVDIPHPVRDKAQILEMIEHQITPSTRVCSFSQIDTITGMQLPMKDVSMITRPRDILLVCDGAQAPGMLEVDVKALGVDAFASSSHKWLLAPKGSGVLYVRKDVQDRIRPISVFNPVGEEDNYSIYSAQSGSSNVAHIYGHGAAVDFHNAIGRKRIEARCRSLSKRVRAHLREIPALTLMTPDQDELSSGMVSFAVDPDKASNGEIYSYFSNEHNIVLKTTQGTYPYVPADQETGPRISYNAIRVSTHIFNTEDEVDKMAELMKAYLA